MKISLNWLSNYIDIDYKKLNIDELVNRLAILGFEVESVEKINRNFEKVVIGKVLAKEKHPDADKLSICKVQVDREENDLLQIVCGAPNVAKDQTVAVALVGAKLDDFKIKKSKIRGVESFGMICAEDELGIGDSHEGIMVLDDSLEAGTPFGQLYGFEDTVLELEITSNRPDVLGHLGFAREVAFLLNKELKLPKFNFKENSEKISDYLSIENKSLESCPRYASRLIKNCKIKKSPKWLEEYLIAVGLNPINNIVDITNFIMLETAHPMHAFDYEQIEDKKIIIRKANDKEEFVTLDGKKHVLDKGMLLICDGKKPVALAGVMGGENSGITANSKDVLLEVASFNLADIRHTSGALKINTDSSKRFERGVDLNDIEFVINRAAALIAEYSGGEIVSGILNSGKEKNDFLEINVRYSRINTVLGFEISKEQILKDLNKIDLQTKTIDDDTFRVTVPSFRGDVKREIDIIEEVVRLYGYDKIPDDLSCNITLEIEDSREEIMTTKVRNALLALGLTEVCCKSMVDEKYCKLFEEKAVKIAHPLNEEQNHLRTNLLLSLLTIAKNNFNRKYDKINIFEVSRRFYLDTKDDIIEEDMGSILIGGLRNRLLWNTEQAIYDFYDIKGYASQFAIAMGLENISYQKSKSNNFDLNQTLDLYSNGVFIGSFGLVSKDILKVYETSESLYAFEFKMKDLEKALAKSSFKLKELSKFQKIVKDISFMIDSKLDSAVIMEAIYKYGGQKLENIEVVDYYNGDQLEAGKKSYTYRMYFQSYNKTMKEKEIDKYLKSIIKGVAEDFGAKLR